MYKKYNEYKLEVVFISTIILTCEEAHGDQ